ncbi:unnamed protein product [Arabidopsis halleri]
MREKYKGPRSTKPSKLIMHFWIEIRLLAPRSAGNGSKIRV